jgi:hypothetical protein
MNKAERIQIIRDSPETGEYKSINYKNTDDIMPVKNIPLNSLLYNPYNGRIRSIVMSYESTFHKLNPEDENDKLIIEQYLYDSATNRNDKTLSSLEDKGQQEVGIVTKDGVIIDGNRRALLLNIINKKNDSSIPFKAIVLPDELQDNEKAILILETSYQMGVDSKVDYNPIEKYLRCEELHKTHDIKIEDIAFNMSESPKKIQEWLNILELMDEYLIKLKTPRIYTRLEKREGHFVDLIKYLKTYKRGHATNWEYSEADIEQMKQVYFDYIRLGVPVQKTRIIGRPRAAKSFFCHKNIWTEFINEHEKIIKSYTDPEFHSIKRDKPEASNEDIIRDIEVKWKENLEEKLNENLSFSETALKDVIEFYSPLKILKRVINSLGQIDEESLSNLPNEEVLKLINIINNKISEFKTKISK